MARILRFLRSPGLALGVLIFLAVYGGAAAWLSLSHPSAWAVFLGLDHPFSSAPFLTACALLFVNTLACTWDRTNRLRGLWRGVLPPGSEALPGGSPPLQRAFLQECGFRPRGQALFRHRPALWGGWVLHVGLLVLMAGVLVQQLFHDGGLFEVAVGERVHLSDPGVTFSRQSGALAPENPPDLWVGLDSFDPFQHQPGFAPDRASRIVLERPGRSPGRFTLDRARGGSVGGIRVFQAIPSGLALLLEVQGLEPRVLHLKTTGPKEASVEVADTSGQARFVLTAERPIEDPRGTGALEVRLESGGAAVPLVQGSVFTLAGRATRLAGFSRWAGFSYSVSPGMPGVFAGFSLVLAGCAIMIFPAGVARPDGETGAYRFYLTRGSEALAGLWLQRGRA